MLTPQSVDRAHPFPYISNLSLNLAVVVRDPATGENRFARVKVPRLLPRFYALPDGERFLPIEQLIAAHLESLFPGMEIVSQHPFRLTLDAELAVDEDAAADLLAAVQSGLHRRLRLNDAVRLEIDNGHVGERARPAHVGARAQPRRRVRDRGAARARRAVGAVRPGAAGSEGRGVAAADAAAARCSTARADVFRVVAEGDVLVHHPYDSFRTSVEAFLTQAATDPDVLAIKHTLYRTSGRDNPIVRALIRAAQAGREVVALIELKARFDEGSNIEWARRLEQAGVHVVYGIVGLKTHAKIALVVRREAGHIRRYCHIGTGNYNPTTADTYEDVGPAVGATRARRGPARALQLPHRLRPPAGLPASCSSRR